MTMRDEQIGQRDYSEKVFDQLKAANEWGGDGAVAGILKCLVRDKDLPIEVNRAALKGLHRLHRDMGEPYTPHDFETWNVDFDQMPPPGEHLNRAPRKYDPTPEGYDTRWGSEKWCDHHLTIHDFGCPSVKG